MAFRIERVANPMIRFLRIAPFILLLTVSQPSTEASIVITATETGGDVVFDYTGSIDTTALAVDSVSQPSFSSGIDPSNGYVFFGTGGAYTWYLAGSTATFGTGAYTTASVSNTADTFAVASSAFALPSGYTGFNLDNSVALLTGQMTFTGASFASLEITPGTYVWTDLSGGQTMTFTTVPEPNAMTLACIATIAAAIRRNRRRGDVMHPIA